MERKSISDLQAESFDKVNAITLSGGMTGESGAVLKRALRPGDIVGGSYRLDSLLGRGGMGYVFAVRHISLERDYALKMLSPEQLNDTARMRFENEGRAIAKLEHSNIVKVYDMGLDEGICPYYVMDRLDGDSLADLIQKRGPLPFKIALDSLRQIAEGLAYAHSKGIIHRDMKPSNVVILSDASGKLTAKIVDFGIAKFLPGSSLSAQSQTATGQVFGSPLYMSPEQSMGDSIDERSDIYSLGCTIYEMLTGKAPFRGENALATIILHQTGKIPDVLLNAEHKVPEETQFLIDKCLSKKPGDRYQSMEQLLHDVDRLSHGQSIAKNELVDGLAPAYKSSNTWSGVSNRPIFLAGIVVLFVLLVGGLSWVGYNAYKQKQALTAPDERLAQISAESVTVNNKVVGKFESRKLNVAQVVINKDDLLLVDKIRAAWKNFGQVKVDVVQTKEGKRRRISLPQYQCGALSQPMVDSQDARGVVLVLTDRLLRLDTAGSNEANLTLAVPEFIDHFPANLFQSLNLRKPLGEMMNLASDSDNQLVNLSMSHILQKASTWTELSDLWLSDLTLSEENCRYLDNCKYLKQLNLSNCGVTDEIVKHVFLRRLMDIRLNKCAHVDSILRALKSSVSLQGLHIELCNFEPEALAQMNEAPILTSFDLTLVENRPKSLAKAPSTEDISDLPSEEDVRRASETNQDNLAHDAFAYLKAFEHHQIPMLFLVHGRHLTMSDIIVISSWPVTALLALDENSYTAAEMRNIKSSHFGAKVKFQRFY